MLEKIRTSSILGLALMSSAKNIQTIQSISELENLWNKPQVAKFLNVSTATVDQWVSRRTGPRFFKVGALVRFKPADVYQYLENCRSGGGIAA